ncbi:MAG TPA: LuxR C-terminal-related transcriptional regulator [Geminicoccaceae bacterium]|nr:LuxR C-terminal-related transcriptional regulator [Geminicoccus sp.]HMU52576.1 LuxR C-terminal-related transcriptional regulator [Geminicoccaceae bacterium]
MDRRYPNAGGAEPDELERGRSCYEHRAWGDAYQAFLLADRAAGLEADDLELLAMSAYLIGRDDEYLAVQERAFHAHLEAGRRIRAVRCAFWLGLRLFLRGETGRATGWLARAQRLLEGHEDDCAERGYLLLPLVDQHLAVGDHAAAYDVAASAAEIGERCREADLVACARHEQGRIQIQQGQIAEGLALLDEAMVAVTAGELSPLMTGLIYCSVIEACQQVYALDRAREWTSALTQWCEGQPQIVAFTGVCLVHRAEIMQLRGAWRAAIEEARRARERSKGANRLATAAAFYQQAEVHRLRGEFVAAERAYRNASQAGLEPQPGLALLRLAQGDPNTAASAIRRLVSTTMSRLERTRLLPACIEIMLAVDNVEEARTACRELEEMAESFDAAAVAAMAAHGRGSVELAEGDARAALGSLRRAFELWQRLDVPYAVARVRVLLGEAYRSLGDDDGGRLELEAARALFERLGAAPDLAHIDSSARDATSGRPHGLTPRELQVLRLVAAGNTNKAIAAELSLSEKTVDRHVSNMLTKLDVPSRAAATAYAYEHKLI